MSEAERATLAASFHRLEQVLQTRGPSLYTNLAPPATAAELQPLRTALNGNTIEVLEAWYQWHNGTADRSTRLLPLGVPLSINESLEDRRSIQSIPFVDKLRKSSVKLMDDGSGDGFFLDVTAAKPTVFYHMLEDPFPLGFGTLDQFVDLIAQGFETGVLYTNASGEFEFDLDGFEAFEAAHLRKIGSR